MDGTPKPSLTHNPKNALWSIWDEVSASALGSGPRQTREPQVKTPYGPVRDEVSASVPTAVIFVIFRYGSSSPLHPVVAVPAFRLTLDRPIDKLLSIRMPQAAKRTTGR